MEHEAVRSQLQLLSTEVIYEILDALHDLKDGVIRPAAKNIIWDRVATLGGEWPTRVLDEGERTERALIGYCGQSRPYDDEHRVARIMTRPNGRDGYEYECRCGRRSDINICDPLSLDIRWCQVSPSVRVWPVVFPEDGPRRGDGTPVAFFKVCRHSRGAQDPLHAPDYSGERCLCRWPLGDTDVLLPSQ